ncbi:MAG: hypothetical protein SFW36_08125 [Leptolyngbyaceae cyanobacterium bins.59]|nr:hypothetical protein [Leptolyngbyaceae cyanobacterium bins.59]
MPIFLLLLPLIFEWLYLRDQENCWRRSFLLTGILFGILLTAITEFLTLFRWLTFSSVVIAWGGITLLLGLRYGRSRSAKFSSLPSQLANQMKGILRHPVYWFPLGSLVVITLIAGLVAIVAPPNTWDVMTYHLPRVVHWMQNQGVMHYPTSYLPQLYHGPFSEFSLTHLYLLSDSDQLVNLPQWSAMVGCLIGISLVAQGLGADGKGQLWAALVCATIPMGIFQASGAKNDYILAFWLVGLAYHLLRLQTQGMTFLDILLFGSCLGLALFTKGTAYLFSVPFVIWFAGISIKQHRQRSWQPILLVLLIAILINSGHYLRNFDLFGTPITTGGQERYSNEVINLASLVSNVVRNLSLHTLLPFDSPSNQWVEQSANFIHRIVGIAPNDPRVTWQGTQFFVPMLATRQWTEDLIGNPLHLLLILLSLVVLTVSPKIRNRTLLMGYSSALVGAFFLFCLLLKWQPWHSRLHLPLFVLFAAPIGIVLAHCWNMRLLVFSSLIALVVWAVPLSLNHPSRSLLSPPNVFTNSRISLYFQGNERLQQAYTSVVNSVDPTCQNIGLTLGPDIWEYPIWVLMKQRSAEPIRIAHINVQNPSARLANEEPYNRFVPCANVVLTSSTPNPAGMDADSGRRSLMLPSTQSKIEGSPAHQPTPVITPRA